MGIDEGVYLEKLEVLGVDSQLSSNCYLVVLRFSMDGKLPLHSQKMSQSPFVLNDMQNLHLLKQFEIVHLNRPFQ